MQETPVRFLGWEVPPGEGIGYPLQYSWASLVASACSVGDLGSIPGLGRSPGGGHGNPLQYSCLENPQRTEKPGGLQSMGLQRVGHDWVPKPSTARVCLEAQNLCTKLGLAEWWSQPVENLLHFRKNKTLSQTCFFPWRCWVYLGVQSWVLWKNQQWCRHNLLQSSLCEENCNQL